MAPGSCRCRRRAADSHRPRHPRAARARNPQASRATASPAADRHQEAERRRALGGEIGQVDAQRLLGHRGSGSSGRKCTPPITPSVVSTRSQPGGGSITAASSPSPKAPGWVAIGRKYFAIRRSSPDPSPSASGIDFGLPKLRRTVAAGRSLMPRPAAAKAFHLLHRLSIAPRLTAPAVPDHLAPARGSIGRNGQLASPNSAGRAARARWSSTAFAMPVSARSTKAWAMSTYSERITRAGMSLRMASS